MILTAAILTGCLLDYLFGDPAVIVHPVVLMGRRIVKAEQVLRGRFSGTQEGELAAGRILAALLPLCTFVLTFGICRLCLRIHPVLYYLMETFWCYQALAARNLAVEAERVKKALDRAQRSCGESGQAEDTECRPVCEDDRRKDTNAASQSGTSGIPVADLRPAREQIARIVGRDTQHLDAAGITRACVETVAENFSDGVAAPLLYMLIGGAPLALTYKAVNTMDSMIGYKNDRYLYFGRAAARLDDLAGFLPSRIAALFWIAAAYLDPSADGRNAWRIFLRDRRKHESPNAAQTESACAGALHIRLAGPASYFGRTVSKPYLGEDDRPIETEDISRSIRLMWVCSFLLFAAGISIRILTLSLM